MSGRIAVAVVLVSLAAAPLAGAQELAGSFDQLRVLVKRGDTITLTDTTGREVTGRIVDLSPAALAVLVGKERHDFPAGAVSTISQRREDSLGNGAKVGFATGFVLGLIGGLSVASTHDEVGAGTATVVALFYGGLGAGIGVGLDAMVKTTQVIYAKTGGAAPSIALAPLVTPARKGLAVSVRF